MSFNLHGIYKYIKTIDPIRAKYVTRKMISRIFTSEETKT